MAFPGLLIEYFVAGAIVLIWVRQLPSVNGYLESVPAAYLPAAFLLLYVLGMAVDFCAWGITRYPKKWVRRPIYRKYRHTDATDTESGTLRQARIALHAPELAKELALRSSRDRIARGCIVNAIFATMFVLSLPVGLLLTVFAIAVWISFESLSYRYELCAESVVNEKLEGRFPLGAS